MLYYLFQWLDKYDFPGAGMFGYTSFRALMAIILALLISSIWGDKFIDLLKRKQITETQRDANIDPFGVLKNGTPDEFYFKNDGLLHENAEWPNYVLSSGCDVPPGVSLENIRSFFRALDDYNQTVK